MQNLKYANKNMSKKKMHIIVALKKLDAMKEVYKGEIGINLRK